MRLPWVDALRSERVSRQKYGQMAEAYLCGSST